LFFEAECDVTAALRATENDVTSHDNANRLITGPSTSDYPELPVTSKAADKDNQFHAFNSHPEIYCNIMN